MMRGASSREIIQQPLVNWFRLFVKNMERLELEHFVSSNQIKKFSILLEIITRLLNAVNDDREFSDNYTIYQHKSYFRIDRDYFRLCEIFEVASINLCHMLKELKMFEELIAYCREILKRDIHSAYPYYYLYFAYCKLNKPFRAKTAKSIAKLRRTRRKVIFRTICKRPSRLKRVLIPNYRFWNTWKYLSWRRGTNL